MIVSDIGIKSFVIKITYIKVKNARNKKSKSMHWFKGE